MNAFLKTTLISLALASGLIASGCRPQPEATIAPATSIPVPVPTSEPTATPLPAVTPTAAPCAETQGKITADMFTSQVTGKDFHYRVYTPPCYASTGRRYPLMVMLHGFVENSDAMNDDQWVRLGLPDAADKGYVSGALPPVVILMPNGLDASYGRDDSPVGKVIVTELLPQASQKLCLWGDAPHQAIGGLSRGGFWALSTAFLNPGVFGKVGGHSPFVYDGDFPDFNPTNLLDTPIDLQGLSIYIDHGPDDYVAEGVRELVSKLRAHGVQPQYVVNPSGKHTEDYWSAHVADYLAFYTSDWPKDASQYPACGS